MAKKNNLILRAAMAPWSCLLLLAITVPYFKSKGLTLPEIFLGQSIFSIALTVFELPSGYLSDKISRKLTLILAGLFKGLGGLMVIYTDSLAMLLATYTLLGIANSFFSGADIAVIHDTNAGDDEAIGKEMANLAMISNLSSTFGIFAGGIIASYSLHYAAVANAAVAFLPFVVFLFLAEPKAPHQANSKERAKRGMVAHMKKDFRTAIDVLFNSGPKTTQLFVAILLLKIPLVMALVTYQDFFSSLGMASSVIGLIIAAGCVLSGLAARSVAALAPKLSTQSVIVMCFAGVSVCYLANSIGSMYLAALSLIIIYLIKVVVGVALIKSFNEDLVPELRASLNSFLSLATRLVIAVVAPIWGLLIAKTSISSASIGLGIVYLALLAVVALMAVGQRRGASGYKNQEVARPTHC